MTSTFSEESEHYMQISMTITSNLLKKIRVWVVEKCKIRKTTPISFQLSGNTNVLQLQYSKITLKITVKKC